MDPGLADSRCAEQRAPVIPVVVRVSRRAGRRAEDQIPVFPWRAGGEAFGALAAAGRAELSDERRRQGQDELRVSLPGLDALRRQTAWREVERPSVVMQAQRLPADYGRTSARLRMRQLAHRTRRSGRAAGRPGYGAGALPTTLAPAGPAARPGYSRTCTAIRPGYLWAKFFSSFRAFVPFLAR